MTVNNSVIVWEIDPDLFEVMIGKSTYTGTKDYIQDVCNQQYIKIKEFIIISKSKGLSDKTHECYHDWQLYQSFSFYNTYCSKCQVKKNE